MRTGQSIYYHIGTDILYNIQYTIIRIIVWNGPEGIPTSFDLYVSQIPFFTGINPYSLDGANVGVFQSGGFSERDIYAAQNIPNYVFVLGNSRTMGPNRLSYALNLTGRYRLIYNLQLVLQTKAEQDKNKHWYLIVL